MKKFHFSLDSIHFPKFSFQSQLTKYTLLKEQDHAKLVTKGNDPKNGMNKT